MKEYELTKELSLLIKTSNEKISIYNNLTQANVLKRLIYLKKMIRNGSFDAIEFCDILELQLFDCKSYAELREKKLDNFELVKGFRRLSICVFNAENNFKGVYVYLN